MYVPLRVHGHHSMLTGVDAPRRLLERARALGLSALALCDVDTLSGLVDFLLAAREVEGVRPIVGAEISDPSGAPGRLIALVETAQGYKNLCKLVSARHLGADPGVVGAKLDGPEHFRLAECAAEHREGLIFLVDHPRLLVALAGRVDARSLFAAISPAGLHTPKSRRAIAAEAERNVHRAPPRRAGLEEQNEFDPPRRRGEEWLESPKVPAPERPAPAHALIEAARALGLATIAVPDVYCAFASGFADHRVRVAIKHNALLVDLPDSFVASLPAHLLAPGEARALFADLPECSGPFAAREHGALARTFDVAERCTFTPELGGILFPTIELEAAQTAYSRLVALSFSGASERYKPLKPEVVRRLDYELSTIEGLGFSAYFLLVKQIADFARDRGIPCVGRGSAADSLVAYCLRLTDADPLRYRLTFERFLNPTRRDRPDIDLDFCWRRRDEVLEHVYTLFGAERTAMIATIATCGVRAAFREAALVEGLPPAEVHRWSRKLPYYYDAGAAAPRDNGEVPDGDASEYERPTPAARSAEATPTRGEPVHGDAARKNAHDDVAQDHAHSDEERDEPPTRIVLPPELSDNRIARAFRDTPEATGFPFDDPRYVRVLGAAARLVDAPRHYGLHPGGVVVSPGVISDYAPCQRAAKGVVVTQFDKNAVEAIGLVKMDLLGNRALTVVDDCVKTLAARGVVVDVETIPEDDPRTAETLKKGLTLGCFQVESPGMRNLLQQIGARDMDDVIQAVALIRPGPAGSGMKDAYVRRFRKLEPPTPPHPRLADVLWDTYGVMLYQEDVMQVASTLAGMDLAEADLLRRALQKRRAHELAALCERFVSGCIGQGVAREDALRAWDLIANFASFGFCKAHAVTYGRIAYRAVWLKTHYPAEYLTAFLESDTGYYDARVYVEEARRLGVPILGPDVNKSARGYRVELSTSASARMSTHEEARSTIAEHSRVQREVARHDEHAPRDVARGEKPTQDESPRRGEQVSREIVRGSELSARDLARGEDRAQHTVTQPRFGHGSAALRLGLACVKGLQVRTLDAIFDARAQDGPFVSLPDFLERTGARTDETEHLIQCGAFDAFDRTIPELLWRLHLLRAPERRAPRADAGGASLDPEVLAACRATPRQRDTIRNARARTQGWNGKGIGLGAADLAPGESASLFQEREPSALALPRLPDLDPRVRGRLEHQILGVSVHAHPTVLFPCPADERIAARAGRPPHPIECAALADFQGARVTLHGWPAATRHVRTHDGRTMRFLTLEDESGLAEVVIFPDVYERDGAHLAEFGALCVTGVVENQMGACTLHAERIW